VISPAVVKILSVFFANPGREHYGLGLMRSTNVKAGSLYPILDRLERAGWLTATDEDIDPRSAGRPRRRLYRLTAIGEREGLKAVADFYEGLTPAPGWLPWPGIA
jgi:DNA-binding PadR family transcriptional regulator